MRVGEKVILKNSQWNSELMCATLKTRNKNTWQKKKKKERDLFFCSVGGD